MSFFLFGQRRPAEQRLNKAMAKKSAFQKKKGRSAHPAGGQKKDATSSNKSVRSKCVGLRPRVNSQEGPTCPVEDAEGGRDHGDGGRLGEGSPHEEHAAGTGDPRRRHEVRERDSRGR